MKNLTIRDLYSNFESLINNNVSIEGWVRTVRNSKLFVFI